MLSCVVLRRFVDAIMEMAQRSGLKWDRSKEIGYTVKRILSPYHNLFLKEFDPATGKIPAWLPGDFHKRWIEVLSEGRLPDIGYNHHGFYVKAKREPDRDAGTSAGASKQTAGAAENDEKSNQQDKTKKPSSPRIYPQPFTCFDFSAIPQREWLYARHYMRAIASATIGPGGSGKSSLDLVEGVAMSTGRNLLGEQPTERSRVWYHNGEDPPQELDRRIAAICLYYKIDPHELEDCFFRTSGLDMPIKIAGGNGDVKLDRSVANAIITGIQENGIDVLILDPLITLHSLAEAENHKMDPVLREFARIASETNCAIELAHHTRKKVSGQEDYTTADARGASAIIDAVRSARTLNGLSNGDAALLGVDDEIERLSYFRLDKGKANMTRRAASAYFCLSQRRENRALNPRANSVRVYGE
jgi:AAA domain-containing protein